MHKIFITLGLIFGILCLLHFSQGCSDQNPVKISNKSVLDSNPAVLDVQRCADYHNTEVERLKILDKETGCLSENLFGDFQAILEEMATRDPAMAAGRDQMDRSREILATMVRIQNTGHQPLEILDILRLCIEEFEQGTETHPSVMKNLEEALDLLISDESHLLNDKLIQLKSLTDELGSAEEIGVVGVFLGSHERSLNKRYEDPNRPWWWRWVVISDVMGAYAGGPAVGAIYSAWTELFFVDMDPPDGHY